MRRLPPLAALRAFEAAARQLSFKRAAQELHVTPTAISHQIRLLEETLGLPLFERHTRRVAMTAAAQRLFPVLRDGFDAFQQAIDGLVQERHRPSVTISATVAFTAKWLMPRLSRFRAERPDIDLKLLATDDVVDLDAGAADFAIRYGRGPFPGSVAGSRVVDRFAPVANPRLALRAPDDLRAATLLHFEWRRRDATTPVWSRWLAEAGVSGVDGDAGLRFSEESHAIQAAIGGLGVALLSLTLVAEELAAGTLVVPFGPEIDGPAFHLLQRREPAPDGPQAAVKSWLLAELRRRGPGVGDRRGAAAQPARRKPAS